jgi:hypothetical protein
MPIRRSSLILPFPRHPQDPRSFRSQRKSQAMTAWLSLNRGIGAYNDAPWHFLNFFPDPHGHG